jgi:hypothetical protein
MLITCSTTELHAQPLPSFFTTLKNFSLSHTVDQGGEKDFKIADNRTKHYNFVFSPNSILSQRQLTIKE